MHLHRSFFVLELTKIVDGTIFEVDLTPIFVRFELALEMFLGHVSV